MEAKRILIVDDNPGCVDLLKEVVLASLKDSSIDIKIFEAYDGEEAQAMIVNYELDGRRPDLVLSDIEMGSRPNGIELCRLIKSLSSNINVVLMSGKDEYQQEAEDAGCDLFMEKPLDFLRLEEAVRRLLE